jgi:hypothetical protein
MRDTSTLGQNWKWLSPNGMSVFPSMADKRRLQRYAGCVPTPDLDGSAAEQNPVGKLGCQSGSL